MASFVDFMNDKAKELYKDNVKGFKKRCKKSKMYIRDDKTYIHLKGPKCIPVLQLLDLSNFQDVAFGEMNNYTVADLKKICDLFPKMWRAWGVLPEDCPVDLCRSYLDIFFEYYDSNKKRLQDDKKDLYYTKVVVPEYNCPAFAYLNLRHSKITDGAPSETFSSEDSKVLPREYCCRGSRGTRAYIAGGVVNFYKTY